jgi:hypothetical protein
MAQMLRFDRLHLRKHLLVVGGSVCPGMDAPVAVRAKRYHKARIIGAAITKPSDVVRFEVRNAAGSEKWSFAPAALAIPARPRNDIVPHVSAALNDCSHSLAAGRRRIRRGKRPALERLEVWKRCGRRGLYRFNQRFKWPEFEHDSIALAPIAIWRTFNVMAFANELPLKSVAVRYFLKDEQVFPIGNMSLNRAVAAQKLHISDLSLTEVFEHAVGPDAVSIAVRQTFLTCDCDDQRMAAEGDDPAPLAASEARMNVRFAVVDSRPFEVPGHRFPRPILRNYLGAVWPVEQRRRGVVSNFPNFAGTGAGSTPQALPNITFNNEANS